MECLWIWADVLQSRTLFVDAEENTTDPLYVGAGRRIAGSREDLGERRHRGITVGWLLRLR
jgi:hypothetical protein